MLELEWALYAASPRQCLRTCAQHIVLMVGFGGAIGALCNDDSIACCPFQALIEKAPHTGISPTMLQLLSLALLFCAVLFHTEFRLFREIFDQTLMPACPRVLLSAILMWLFVKYSHLQYFDWNTGMMFGTMLAASDPVAVVAGMKELDAGLSLFTSISLGSMIDRCGVVIFIPSLAAVFDDEPVEAGGVVLFTIVNIVGAGAFGLLYLCFAVMILRLCRQEMPVVRCVDLRHGAFLLLLHGNAPGHL